MAANHGGPVLRNVRRALLGDGADLSDRHLLSCFILQRDEDAFSALVKRHGPMVWGVCHRVLGSHQDAEDAFQATFLVLVRKAASIVPREMLGNWLYGVAFQTAVRVRSMNTKRRARERQVEKMPEPAAAEQDLWNDLRPLLDQELSRLPDKYRAAVVLCDLEGKTYQQAARQIGCPAGTLAARLSRGRAMLAKRLARHGLAVSGGALAAVLSQNVASACVPPSVVSSTIMAASLFAAGQAGATGTISVKVAALTEGVLRTMSMSKLKATITVLALGLMATGAVLTCHVAAAHSNKPPVASDRTPAKKDSESVKTEKRSGYLELENVDLIKGIIKGDALSTDDERSFYSYKQQSWELKVGSATKIIIDGKQAKLADLRTIKPEPGSSSERLVFVEWEHEVTADHKVRVKKGTAVRLEGKGIKVRGIIQAKNSSKNTLTIKRILWGFRGESVAPPASTVNVDKDVHVIIDHKPTLFNDLKPGMKVTLQLSAVKELVLDIQAYGAKVDGVLKSVDSGKNTISVNILSAQMTAEGVSVAKDAKVIIHGKEGRLSDLRAGMRVTLQMSAEPEESLIVGITKDKTAGRE